MTSPDELIKIELWLNDSTELTSSVPISWTIKQAITNIRNKLTNNGIPVAGYALFEFYNDIPIQQIEDTVLPVSRIVEGWKKQEGFHLCFLKKNTVKPVGREEFFNNFEKTKKKGTWNRKLSGPLTPPSPKDDESKKTKAKPSKSEPEKADASIPEIISYDEKEGTALVRFHFATDSTFSTFSDHWTLPLTNTTTTQEVCAIIASKLNLSAGSLSLYELDVFGKPHRLSETDTPLNNVKKRIIHGTEKKSKFILRRNIELLRFYLASDIKTFWTFRITEETTAWDICETISERLFLNFEMHESNQDRVLKDDAKILFIYYSWKGTQDKFVLHERGARTTSSTSRIDNQAPTVNTNSEHPQEVVEVAPTATLEDGDEDVYFQIGPLNIPEEWKVDLKDLTVIKVIGDGSFAKVLLGKFKGELVAIKKMMNTDTYEMRKYAQRELDLLIQLRHPNIIKFIGCWQTDKAVFMITEFVSRGDLRNLLSDMSMTLSWKFRLKIATDVVSAIEHYFSKGFIHRDLKSENLLVANDFTIKLCDFGLARDNLGRDRSMTLVGTDDWMSPEVILGDDYDQSADIFSFGMVLVELITRLKPPLREPRNYFQFPVEQFKSNCPADCPPPFIQLALHCLQYEPKNRPNIQDIISELKKISESITE